MRPTLFVLDGHYHVFRAFYAFTGLVGPRGQQTNAVFGFLQMLTKLREKYAPDYLAAAFDSRDPSFRHERFPDYKAQRKAAPEALHEQVPVIRHPAPVRRGAEGPPRGARDSRGP